MTSAWLVLPEASNGEEPEYVENPPYGVEYYSGSPVGSRWVVWVRASNLVDLLSNSDVSELKGSEAMNRLLSTPAVNSGANESSFRVNTDG